MNTCAMKAARRRPSWLGSSLVKQKRRLPVGALHGGSPHQGWFGGTVRRDNAGCLLGLIDEVVVIPEVAVEGAGKLGRAGTEGGAAAFKEEDRNQAALRRVRVRGEPAETGSFVRAGTCLAENRELGKAGAEAARSTVLDGASHSVLEIRNVLGDVEGALDTRSKRGDVSRGGGMLQVVERSAVSKCGHIGAQLQRGHGNALTEAAHAAYAALGDGQWVVRISA